MSRGFESHLTYQRTNMTEQSVIIDEGPWSIMLWDGFKYALQSDIFDHDVALIIDGNFGSMEAKKLYAEALAKQMNEGIKALREK